MLGLTRYIVTFAFIMVTVTWGLASLFGVPNDASDPWPLLACAVGGSAVAFGISELVYLRPRRRRILAGFEDAAPTVPDPDAGTEDLIGDGYDAAADGPTVPQLTWSPLQLAQLDEIERALEADDPALARLLAAGLDRQPVRRRLRGLRIRAATRLRGLRIRAATRLRRIVRGLGARRRSQ